jgi:dihydroorotate dehydrogenase
MTKIKISIALFSLGYRFTRRLAIIFFKIESLISGKFFDLELVVDFGNKYMAKLDDCASEVFFNFNIPNGMDREIYDLHFRSPLISASFQSDKKSLVRWRKMGLGGITFKTIMKNKREGNNRPRLAEVKSKDETFLLNALGLPGEGVDSFLDSICTEDIIQLPAPMGFSIGGDSPEEYLDVFQSIHRQLEGKIPQYFYEINISCPNTVDGKSLSEKPEALARLLQTIRTESERVIFIKISPDTSNQSLILMAERVNSFPKIGINAGNTTYRTRKIMGLTQKQFRPDEGGLSGSLLFDRTLEIMHLLKPFSFPKIATGGINTGKKAKAVLDAGADLIGMATALVLDPYCIPKINHYLGRKE